MRIAISGAGVAGSASAYWLQRTGHTRVFAGEFRDDFQLPDYGIADPVM